MSTIPPARQYAIPAVSLADIEWEMARAEVRSLVGDAALHDVARRTGRSPAEALDLLTAGPRWLLTEI